MKLEPGKLEPGETKRMRATAARARKATEERRERIKSDWARRHPELAAGERGLRKGRAQRLERWKHKNEGTAETHDHVFQYGPGRCNEGALVRLYRTGAIDADQLAAAVEIAEVVERICGDVAVRTASLETRVDVTRIGDGSFYERLGQVRREIAYTRWRAALRRSGMNVHAVLDMLVGRFSEYGPAGFTVVARRYRMHNRRAKALLIDALDAWPPILRTACKEIDEAVLAAAQAGIV